MLKQFFRPISLAKPEPGDNKPVDLEKLYQDQVDLQHIQYDVAQVQVVRQLQHHLEQLTQYPDSAPGRGKWSLQRYLARNKSVCQSLYVYGGVGSGKSMIMDMFYTACPMREKRRVHFHAFMREVHTFMHQWRQQNDGSPLQPLAEHIRSTVRLLCFDEFHVSDIADAMILGRLFKSLLDLGVIFAATSNRHPDELYLGGLQRELFLPFIQLLHERADIIQLSAAQDYRLGHLKSMETSYYYPLSSDAERFLQNSYDELTNFATREKGFLLILGRTVELSVVHNDVAQATFEELCKTPLGAADYLEISRKFNTLMISGIPCFRPENRNEAKRFMTLIDILYEHKVKLICTAEVPPESLYPQGDGAFEFKRTVSRLNEMQSEAYWSAEHHPD